MEGGTMQYDVVMGGPGPPGADARGAPLNTPAAEDRFVLLTATKAIRLPTPPQMNNHGNYIISLGNLCRWLAGQAEAARGGKYPPPVPPPVGGLSTTPPA